MDVGNSNRGQTLAQKSKPKPTPAAGRFDYLNFGKDNSEKSMTSRQEDDEDDEWGMNQVSA